MKIIIPLTAFTDFFFCLKFFWILIILKNKTMLTKNKSTAETQMECYIATKQLQACCVVYVKRIITILDFALYKGYHK